MAWKTWGPVVHLDELKHTLSANLTLDSRRAAWLPAQRALAVADLHLGYAWAHRLCGQLMPLGSTDDMTARLVNLQADYQPETIVILGDIVHRAIPIPALEDELRALFAALSPLSELVFLIGNHDRELQRLLNDWRLPVRLRTSWTADPFLLVHGDEPVPTDTRLRVIMGHEHPAITIGDGVTTSHKCPCFLVGKEVIVLPSFSSWAAGTDVRSNLYLSEIARGAQFTAAIAICGERLLPLELASARMPRRRARLPEKS